MDRLGKKLYGEELASIMAVRVGGGRQEKALLIFSFKLEMQT